MHVQFNGETNTVSVNGARISLEALEAIANPDPARFYRFCRIGETVFVNSYAIREGEAMAFTLPEGAV